MDLVIITFNKDLHLCRWQLKSIKKFLEPCTIHIIVNEQDHNYAKDYLKDQVKQLENHPVHFWNRNKILGKIPERLNGWISQQLLKLLLPINRDYIVLDCKDIFIKDTKLDDLIKEQYKNQSNVRQCNTWKHFAQLLTLRLRAYYKRNISYKKIKDIQTPRLIEQSIKEKILEIFHNKNKFIDWFIKIDMPSEFILYDAVRLYENKISKKVFLEKEIVGIWNKEIYKRIDLKNLPNETRIVKLHRRLYDDKKIAKQLDRWLTSKVL